MRRRIRARDLAVVLALLVAGCARKMPPSGGPPDLEPPRILSIVPDSGATGVSRTPRITITFSEGMEPRSAGDAVSIAPLVPIRARRWNGRALTVELAESLAIDHAYTLFVGTDARDRHGNTLRAGRAVTFSTAAEFPPGVIQGKIVPVGFPGPGTFLWCYPLGHAPDSTARDFDVVGLAGEDDDFSVSGLAVPGRYRLWAFADLNHNHSYEPASDLLAPADTTIELVPGDDVATGITLRIVNPRAPGHVKGSVLDSLGDASGIVRLITVSERDTLRRLVYEVSSPAGFDFSMEPGTYRMRAYRDLDRNKVWKADSEPASDEIVIRVPPAETVEAPVFVLRRPKPGGTRP